MPLLTNDVTLANFERKNVLVALVIAILNSRFNNSSADGVPIFKSSLVTAQNALIFCGSKSAADSESCEAGLILLRRRFEPSLNLRPHKYLVWLLG